MIDRADTIDTISAGKEFGKWAELLLNVAEVWTWSFPVCQFLNPFKDEYVLLMDLTPLASPQLVASSYATLLNPILVLFSNTLTSLIGLIKRSLHKYTFLALSSYESLLSLQPRWDSLLSRRGSETRKENNELKDGLHALRAVCLRSFPEFLADLKMGSLGKGGELSPGLADFTLSVCLMFCFISCTDRGTSRRSNIWNGCLKCGALLDRPCSPSVMVIGRWEKEYKSARDRNWEKAMNQRSLSIMFVSCMDQSFDVLRLTCSRADDVITTSINSLNTLSRTSRRPAFGSIFLLNNISYLRQHIIVEPEHPGLVDLLSKPTRDALNSNFRTAKAAYFDSNYTPLMQALTDDPKEKPGKAVTKEKFTRFFDLLEEVMERHKLAKVLEDDAAGRETIGEEVVKLVVPSLQRFTQKHREKEFSKSA